MTFSNPLDATSATDLVNWNVQEWNLVYSRDYGSPEMSLIDPLKKGHDTVPVTGIKLSADKKTVLLEIADLRPVMQMKIKMNIKAADGTLIATDIYNTIHKVAAK